MRRIKNKGNRDTSDVQIKWDDKTHTHQTVNRGTRPLLQRVDPEIRLRHGASGALQEWLSAEPRAENIISIQDST